MAAKADTLQNSPAGSILRLWRSSLGKKYVMAVTGLGLFAFVVVHMAGNLQIFLGPEKINAYAKFLKSNAGLLWTARVGLLAIFLLHITAAIELAVENRRARPIRYSNRKPIASSFANRTIVVSGLIILAFILFHLFHFTFGLVNTQYLGYEDSFGRHDVFRMMIEGFSNPFVSVFYIVSMGLLMLHLSHGLSSTLQSLGLRSNKTFGFFDKAGKTIALLIFIGNCSIPLAILARVIK